MLLIPLEPRVDNLLIEHSLLKNKMVNSELKIWKIEDDTSCLNLQLKTCTDDYKVKNEKWRLNVSDYEIESRQVRK